MKLDDFRRLAQKVGNQAYTRTWLAYGATGMSNHGRGLALGILCPDGAAEASRWADVLTSEAEEPPRELERTTWHGLPLLVAFWDRSDA